MIYYIKDEQTKLKIKFNVPDHKYTDEQLLVIYKGALEELKIKDQWTINKSLCSTIYYSMCKNIEDIPTSSIFKNTFGNTFGLLSFKEIAKHFPKHQKCFWFPLTTYGYNRRKHVLLDAIREVKKRLNKE